MDLFFYKKPIKHRKSQVIRRINRKKRIIQRLFNGFWPGCGVSRLCSLNTFWNLSGSGIMLGSFFFALQSIFTFLSQGVERIKNFGQWYLHLLTTHWRHKGTVNQVLSRAFQISFFRDSSRDPLSEASSFGLPQHRRTPNSKIIAGDRTACLSPYCCRNESKALVNKQHKSQKTDPISCDLFPTFSKK